MRRPVLLHHHFFKNAGTSLDSALYRFFGNCFFEVNGAHANDRIMPHQLIEFLRQEPSAQALSSHHFHARLFDDSAPDLFLTEFPLKHCLLIRHPIARLLSMYRFYSAGSEPGTLPTLARSTTLHDFMLELVERHPDKAISQQVALISRYQGRSSPPAQADLETSVTKLLRFSLMGTVERFDESMACAEYYLSPAFPGIDLACAQENVTNNLVAGDHEAIVERARCLLKSEILDHLLRMNSQDTELWTRASAELDRRIAFIPDWAGRLALHLKRAANASKGSLGWQHRTI